MFDLLRHLLGGLANKAAQIPVSQPTPQRPQAPQVNLGQLAQALGFHTPQAPPKPRTPQASTPQDAFFNQKATLDQALKAGRISPDAYANALNSFEDHALGAPQFKAQDITPSGKKVIANTAKDTAIGIGGWIPRLAINYSQAAGNLGTRAAGGKQQSTQEFYSDPLTRNLAKEVGANGTGKQFFSDLTQLGLTVASPGVSKGVGKFIKAPIPNAAVTSAAIGGPFNAAAEVATNPNANLKDAAKAYGVGTAAGGVLGFAGGLTSKTLHDVTPQVINHAKTLAADQNGFLGMKGAVDRHPAIQAIDAHLKDLNKARDNLTAINASKSAIKANANAYRSALSERNKLYKQISQGGYVGKGKSLADEGGKRPANDIQAQIEAAHNAGDNAKVEALIRQLPKEMQAPMRSALGIKVAEPSNGQLSLPKGQLKVSPLPQQSALKLAGVGKANTSAKGVLQQKLEVQPMLKNPANTTTLVRSSSRVPSLTTNNTTIPQGFKERGLTKSVKRSGEVSPTVQGKVGGIYKPHSMQDIQAQADAKVEGDLAPLTKAINNTLSTKRGSLTDQQVADSIALAKAHDAAGNFDVAQSIYDKLAEHGTAGGQQINAFKLLSNRTPEGMKFKAYRDLKKHGVTLDAGEQLELEGLVDKVKQASFGPQRDMALHDLVQYVGRKIPSKAGDKAVNIWRAGLLTSPVTTGGNILGNATEALTRNLWANPIAALADKSMSLFTGKRTKTLTGGQLAGAKEGLGKAKTYLKTGFDERNPSEKYDVKNVHYDNKFVDNYVNGVYRWMGGQDQPFYYGAQKQAVRDLATADAKNLGLTGQAKADYIAKAGLDFKPQTFKSKSNAESAAEYAVYQNETKLGAAAQGLKKPLGPLGSFLVPFSRVPASVAMRILDRTPVGIAKEMLAQIHNRSFDQRALAEAIGNGSFGPGVILAGYSLGKHGLITGAYPTDQKEQELWKLEGKQPYSVKVGDHWVSLNYMQPFGTLLAIGNQSAQDRKDGKSPSEIVSTAVGAAAKSVESQSFLQGINGILSAVNDPQRSASQYVTSTAGSIVPNFVRSGARATDPNQRDVKGLVNGVKSAIPGLRESLPIKQDAFGGNLPAVNNPLNQFLNPLRPSVARPGDTVTNELRRLQDTKNGIIPTQFSKTTFKGTTLTDKQVRELQSQAGPQIKDAWDKIIQDPKYQTLSDPDKATALKKGMDSINEAVKNHYAQANGLPISGKLSKNAQSVLEGKSVDVFPKAPKPTVVKVSNPVGERYSSPNTKSGKWVQHIQAEAPKRGLDMNAVLAVAAAEGLSGNVGDGGTSYGPFQLHVGGALPAGKDRAWAESPEGINYALDRIADVAKGKTGQAAVEAIVHEFERPADPHGEVARAMSMYGRVDAYSKLKGISTASRSTKSKLKVASSGKTRSGGSTTKGTKAPKIKFSASPKTKVTKAPRIRMAKVKSMKTAKLSFRKPKKIRLSA